MKLMVQFSWTPLLTKEFTQKKMALFNAQMWYLCYNVCMTHLLFSDSSSVWFERKIISIYLSNLRFTLHWTKPITGLSINLKQGLRWAIMISGSSVWVPVPGWTLCPTSYQHLATTLLIPGTLLQPRARAECTRRRRPLSLIDTQNGARLGPAEREELRRCRRGRNFGWTGNWLMKKRRVYSLFWILIKSLCVYNIVCVLAMQVRCSFLFLFSTSL